MTNDTPTDTNPRLRLLTVADLAEEWQVGKGKVRQLVHEHGLPHVRLGKHLRFRPAAVAAWLSEQQAAGAPGGSATLPRVPAFDWSKAG